MNRSKLIVMAVMAGVLIVAAAALMWEDAPPELTGGRLYPELEPRLNDVSKVTLKLDPDVTLTAVLENDAWVVAEKGNFPANLAQIRKVLVSLARTDKVEQKTANPEYYSRLGVQELQDSEGETRIVEVHAGDTLLASVIVGSAAESGNSYLRPTGQADSWLGSEWIDAPARINAWLDATITDIEPARLKQVEIVRSDEEPFLIERLEDGVRLTSAGTELPSKSGEVDRVLGALEDLALDDIVEEAEVADDAWHVARYETNDGLTVVVHSHKTDDALYARLAAEIHADAPGEELQQEANALNTLLVGRTFTVPGYLKDRLAPTLEFVKEAEETGEGSDNADSGTSQ